MKYTFYSILGLILFGWSTTAKAQNTVLNFDNITIASDSFINGSHGDTLFAFYGVEFPIQWDTTYDYWAGALDIDVVLDLMIHDLDIVQWLVGEEVEVTNIHAVGIAILTNKVDAANARLEFSSGAVANITASRVGTEKIRKMRFFQPHDYVAIDYTTKRASVSSLSPPSASGSWPGVHIKHLDVVDVEPLRAEIVSFLNSAENGLPPAVSGSEGRNALSLALRTLERIREHAEHPGVSELSANVQ